MNDLILLTSTYRELKSILLQSDLETCAVLFAKSVTRNNSSRLLVGYVNYPPVDAYIERTSVSAQLKPEYIAPLVKQAKKHNYSVAFVHTHPGSLSTPFFSLTDDRGEELLRRFLDQRGLKGPHAAMVISPAGCLARQLGTAETMSIKHIGHNFEIVAGLNSVEKHDNSYDRQIRAFGKRGQDLLREIRVAIVGLGGTGSIIAQELAHLGVQEYLLIDPDIVEESNLNRLAGAVRKDIGLSKVAIGERQIKSIQPTSSVTAKQGSVLDISTAKLLTETDFIFCCTDSHGSRAVLNQLAYQYYIPCIDMGVSISSKDGNVTHVTGRVQMLSPGLGCLTCAELLDADAVRRDLMTSFQRQADPYFLGDAQPEPAVMPLNASVSSLAVTMFLSAVTGIPAKARYQIYNGITGSVRSINSVIEPICVVCSKRGALGRGDEWDLPARKITTLIE